jgi:hypothetical protein
VAEELRKYRRIAENLFCAGYYSGLISGIERCLKYEDTFVLVDCPSGTGKTLAAVALSMQGCNNKQKDLKLLIGRRPAFVYHFIWPDAIRHQTIYQEIEMVSPQNAALFQNLRSLGEATDPEIVWETLASILPGFDPGSIKGGKKVLVLIIDEVPEDALSVHQLGRARDALKKLKGVCVLLCGTHSKAASMIGLSRSKNNASRDTATSTAKPWAFIITRLPKFDLKISGLEGRWAELLGRADCKHICSAIQCSLSNGGNPWLIATALDRAFEATISNDSAASFQEWQDKFMSGIRDQKFRGDSVGHQFKGLVGQLNLLLDATATAHLSDILLGHHFAFRCIPDYGETCGTDTDPTLADCGGCLYLEKARSRVLGTGLVFYRGICGPSDGNGFGSWQATRFAPPQKDLLLYLMAVWKEGCFEAKSASGKIRTYELVAPFWRSNSAGLIHFPNPNAVNNSGCPYGLLEVLVTAAVKNAAARDTGSCLHSDAAQFISKFMCELGLPPSTHPAFNRDRVLCQIRVPRMLLLTQASQCEQFLSMKGVLGVVERQRNSDEFDLLVQGVGSAVRDSIRVKAKDRPQFDNVDTAKAAAKLFAVNIRVGVIVVRRCCQYWGTSNHNESNRSILKALLEMIPGIGVAYLFSMSSEFVEVQVSTSRNDTGRLIFIQVPERSLRELYPF